MSTPDSPTEKRLEKLSDFQIAQSTMNGKINNQLENLQLSIDKLANVINEIQQTNFRIEKQVNATNGRVNNHDIVIAELKVRIEKCALQEDFTKFDKKFNDYIDTQKTVDEKQSFTIQHLQNKELKASTVIWVAGILVSAFWAVATFVYQAFFTK